MIATTESRVRNCNVNLLVLRPRYSGGPELWHFPLGKRLDLSSPQLPPRQTFPRQLRPHVPALPPGRCPRPLGVLCPVLEPGASAHSRWSTQHIRRPPSKMESSGLRLSFHKSCRPLVFMLISEFCPVQCQRASVSNSSRTSVVYIGIFFSLSYIYLQVHL